MALTTEEQEALDKKLKDEAGNVSRKEFEDLIKSQNALLETVKTMAESSKGNADGLQQVVRSMETLAEGLVNPPTAKEGDVSDDELEHMDRKDLLSLIEKKVGNLIDTKLESLGTDITEVKDSAAKTALLRQVERAKTDHPDFKHLQAEVLTEMKSNQHLTIDEAYVLAKGKNPEKMKEVDELMKKEAEEAGKDGGNGEDKDKKFGGLTPTSGQTEAVTNMTKKEAGDKAWEETMGNIEQILTGDDGVITKQE